MTSATMIGSPAVAREHMNLGPAILVPLGTSGTVRGVLTAGRHPGAMPLAPAARRHARSRSPARPASRWSWPSTAVRLSASPSFEDRDRIARDLHDLVIQRLYATGMSLQGTVSLIGSPEVARPGQCRRGRPGRDDQGDPVLDLRAADPRRTRSLPGLRARILQVADEATGVLGLPAGAAAGRPAGRRRARRCRRAAARACCARRCPTRPGTRAPARSRSRCGRPPSSSLDGPR